LGKPGNRKKKKDVKIPTNFSIDKIQVVMPPGEVPFIRFNEEVKAIILAKLKSGVIIR